jgi:hypothetical protein
VTRKNLPVIVKRQPSQENIDKYYDWITTPHDFTDLRQVQQHLAWLSFGSINGLSEVREVNCGVYIGMSQIIVIDKIDQKGGGQTDLSKYADEYGNLPLTPEQTDLIGQEPKLAMQIQMVERFTAENKRAGYTVVNEASIDKIADGKHEEHVDAAVKEIQEEYNFEKEVEF